MTPRLTRHYPLMVSGANVCEYLTPADCYLLASALDLFLTAPVVREPEHADTQARGLVLAGIFARGAR